MMADVFDASCGVPNELADEVLVQVLIEHIFSSSTAGSAMSAARGGELLICVF